MYKPEHFYPSAYAKNAFAGLDYIKQPAAGGLLSPSSYYAFEGEDPTEDSGVVGGYDLVYEPAVDGGLEALTQQVGINGDCIKIGPPWADEEVPGAFQGFYRLGAAGEVGSSAWSGTGNFAYSVWFNPDTIDAEYLAAQSASVRASFVGTFGLGCFFTFYRYKDAAGDALWATMSGSGKSNTKAYNTSLLTPLVGWHHVVFAVSGSLVPTIYLDGVSQSLTVGSGTTVSPIYTTNGGIGQATLQGGALFDEMAFFSDTAAVDIDALASALYNGGAGKFWNGTAWE